ncbi:hypothetical protein M1697_23575, partial [Salmonella enterica subsp. enterica serovar Oranienburg]|nr:hypothetical protein [Salmonella enterica subsp. enterica serovar Oranienburg]
YAIVWAQASASDDRARDQMDAAARAHRDNVLTVVRGLTGRPDTPADLVDRVTVATSAETYLQFAQLGWEMSSYRVWL